MTKKWEVLPPSNCIKYFQVGRVLFFPFVPYTDSWGAHPFIYCSATPSTTLLPITEPICPEFSARSGYAMARTPPFLFQKKVVHEKSGGIRVDRAPQSHTEGKKRPRSLQPWPAMVRAFGGGLPHARGIFFLLFFCRVQRWTNFSIEFNEVAHLRGS